MRESEKNRLNVSKQARSSYDGTLPDFPICKMTPARRLAVWEILVPLVAERYEAAGIPPHIIRDTLEEVSRLAEDYRCKTGSAGLSKENVIWLRHIYHGELFRIGSLQYQIFHMIYLDEEGCGEHYMHFAQEEKERLPQGTPVVNVHVPSGADLSAAAVEKSLEDAKLFFQQFLPDFKPKAFLCYSWLLYPQMLELLPKESRIASFAARFRIIGQVSDPYGSGAVKRIYGRRYARKAEYPQDTQLQKNAIGHFSKLGMGCGLIEIT